MEPSRRGCWLDSRLCPWAVRGACPAARAEPRAPFRCCPWIGTPPGAGVLPALSTRKPGSAEQCGSADALASSSWTAAACDEFRRHPLEEHLAGATYDCAEQPERNNGATNGDEWSYEWRWGPTSEKQFRAVTFVVYPDGSTREVKGQWQPNAGRTKALLQKACEDIRKLDSGYSMPVLPEGCSCTHPCHAFFRCGTCNAGAKCKLCHVESHRGCLTKQRRSRRKKR